MANSDKPSSPAKKISIEKAIGILNPDKVQPSSFNKIDLFFGGSSHLKTRAMSHEPQKEKCPGRTGSGHEMKRIGEDVFECVACGHSEVGCTHAKTKIQNGRTVCLICNETLR